MLGVGVDGAASRAALAAECRTLLGRDSAQEGYSALGRKFETRQSIGPRWVRAFVESSDLLRGRTPEQWQTDAFGQMQEWCRALGFESR